MLEQFIAARRCATPLIAIRSMNNAATQLLIVKNYEAENPAPPMITWDCGSGFRGINDAGVTAIAKAMPQGVKPSEMTSPPEALAVAGKLDKFSILFFHNPQLFLVQQDQMAGLIVQAIWNLRDKFKTDRRQLVMLGPWFVLPPEINQDVVVIDEPLPTDEQIGAIVTKQFKGASLPEPAAKVVSKAVDALRGLSAFPAEQVTAMSLTRSGLNMENLWERKRQTIEQTPGLSIWRGKESFDNVKGYDNCERYLRMLADGKRPPKGVMFIDEIEKHLAGATGGDLSGVKQDMLGALLTWMQDRKAEGMIFIGVPGSGKSALAKAFGNYAQVPTISFDLGGMQESLVGKSGQNIRTGLKVVDAVTSGETLVIATSNSIQSLPPELRRRFSLGIFFFDLPTKEGREKIWDLYLKQYEIKGRKLPDDTDWTGAEIEKCCRIAWRFECDPAGAASFIVPVAKSDPAQLAYLRKMAHNTFISASEAGIYQFNEEGKSGGDGERDIKLQ